LRARLATYFDEDEIVAVTFGVVVVNAWNRLVPFHPPVGSYQPQVAASTAQAIGA
jgi:hypothetical protein